MGARARTRAGLPAVRLSGTLLTDRITPLILTFNEAPNVGRTLRCLRWASRMVIVDSYSTDDTVAIAQSFPGVEVHQRKFDTHADQWNYGLSRVETDWVLSLDADYVCPTGLVGEILALPEEPEFHGYLARFSYCVCGRPLRSTLYPPRVVLHHREGAHYEQDGHTQRLRVPGRIGRLRSVIRHDDRKPLSAWLAAQARYSADEAEKLLAAAPSELGLVDRLRRTGVLAPALVPLHCLFTRGLVLDGRAGWYYTLQRTYAELLLALRLWDRRLRRESGVGRASRTPEVRTQDPA